MIVTKVLVNWKDKKVIHTVKHRGSEPYNSLIAQGYEEVGVIKSKIVEEGGWDEDIPSTSIRVIGFWKPEFFDPKAKYPE